VALFELGVMSQEQAATLLNGGREVQAIGNLQLESRRRSNARRTFANSGRERQDADIRIREEP
jgi:hypothetical protein